LHACRSTLEDPHELQEQAPEKRAAEAAFKVPEQGAWAEG
jgi:hypothetical protein